MNDRIQKGSKKRAVALVIMGLFLASVMAPVLPDVGAATETEGETEQSSLQITRHRATAEEISQLKEKMGVYEPGRNYNVIVDGHGTGLAPPTEEGWTEMSKSLYIIDDISMDAPEGVDGAPASVDNSQDIWFPPIGNQDGEGSCVCFAVAYYMKTYQEAKEHGWDLSGASWEGGYYGNPTPSYQDRIMSPDFVYHQILYWNGDDGGSTYGDAMNFIQRVGCASWEKMPYDPIDSTSWPSEAAWREAPLYRGATGYTYGLLDDNTDLEDLKTYISNDNLGVISVNANYYSSLTSDDLWTVDNYDGSSTNHANTIVGYDDNFGPYTEEGNTRYGAFKIANSWGKGFTGDSNSDGCFWISYEAMKREVGYYMFMEDQTGYDPELLATFEISHSYRTQCDIGIGIGSTGSPLMEKHFNNWNYKGAPSPFPSNLMALDVSEFADSYAIDGENFFLQIYDSGNSTTGTITNFTMEHYLSYNENGLPDSSSTSTHPPVNTVQYSNVYAETTLDTASPPAVSTTAASNVGITAADLNGNLDDLGSESSCDVWFVYDTTSRSTWQDYTWDTTPATMTATGSFTDSVSSLSEGTTYYYRAVASSTAGTAQGTEASFTTQANAPPVANFSYTPTNPSTMDTIDFTDTSTDSDGTIVNWTWTFGDGTISYQQNPSHSYSSADTYTVQLTARDDHGDTDTSSQQITVSNVGPTADFTYTPTNPSTMDTIDFTDTSTDSDGSIVNWTWTLGDGTTSYMQNPSHSYASADTYTIQLTVRDDQGDTDTTSQQVTVSNVGPTADFTYTPTNPSTMDTIDFTDTSTDSDGSIVNWTWTLGDGTTSYMQNPSHSYASADTYTIQLTVRDDQGDTDTTSQQITVSNVGPTASYTYTPTNPSTQDTITFTDESTDSDGSIVNWTWQFDDGTTSYLQHPSHSYDASGIYQVSLTVRDDTGDTDATSQSVTVYSNEWNSQSNPPHTYMIPEGNVGIGTDSPTDKLHVNGSFRVQDSSASHLFFVDSSTGNVGIGTSSPIAPLDIRADYPAIRVQGSGAGRFEMFLAMGGTRPAMRITGQEGANAGDYGQWVLRTDDATMRYNAYDVSEGVWKQLMTFDYMNERLGINTNEPQARLDVHGDALFNDDGSDHDFRIESTGNTHMFFVDASTNNVGINTNTPQRPLHINDVMRLEPRNTAPDNPSMGDLYMDSNDGVLKVWDGDEWRNCYTPN